MGSSEHHLTRGVSAGWGRPGFAPSPGGRGIGMSVAQCVDGLGPSCLSHLAAAHPQASPFLSSLSSDDGQPAQIHLALSSAPGRLSVTWVTKAECPASAAWFRGIRLPANSSTYSVPRRWWQPRTQVWIHTATLDGLGSSEEFAYVVGDNTTMGCNVTAPIHARAPPARGDFPVTAALLADVGSVEVLGFLVWRTLDERTRPGGPLDADLAIHAGDVSYAGMDTAIPFLNVSKADEWEPLWDLYGDAHQNFSQRRAYQVGVGNHEAWYDWVAVRHRYPMATTTSSSTSDSSSSAASVGAASASASSASASSSSPTSSAAAVAEQLAEPPFWYTFVSGGTHWTMLSSEHDYGPGSAQHGFASAALAAVNRTLTPWSAVAFHRPMYCSDASEFSEHSPGGALQRALEPLLLSHAVDLVVTGHEHAYERVHPNVAGNVTSTPSRLPNGELAYIRPRAPLHLMVGHGGAAQEEQWVRPAPSWSAARFSQGCDFTGERRACALLNGSYGYTHSFGWVHAQFVNRSHARLQTEMVAGDLHDAVWLIRE